MLVVTMNTVVVASNNPKTGIARVGKFGVVGVINTLIDFGLYNALQHYGLARLVANTISTTVAMTVSFFANKQLVFDSGTSRYAREAAMFLVVTAFGLYVLQNGTIWLLTSGPLKPVLSGVIDVAQALGLSHLVSRGFLTNNAAKAVATAVSLTWNYFTYKRWVFING